ncbi:MAG: hypothetical protein ACI8RD_004724, partial [Bacillariaceae sp.]
MFDVLRMNVGWYCILDMLVVKLCILSNDNDIVLVPIAAPNWYFNNIYLTSPLHCFSSMWQQRVLMTLI